MSANSLREGLVRVNLVGLEVLGSNQCVEDAEAGGRKGGREDLNVVDSPPLARAACNEPCLDLGDGAIVEYGELVDPLCADDAQVGRARHDVPRLVVDELALDLELHGVLDERPQRAGLGLGEGRGERLGLWLEGRGRNRARAAEGAR